MSELNQDLTTFNIEIIENMIPVLNDAHKKTPPENRINMLNRLNLLIDSNKFQEYEVYIVDNILPIRLNNDVSFYALFCR